MSGTTDELIGKGKKEAGKIMESKELEAKGKAQEIKGKVEKAADKVSDKIDTVKD